MKRLTIVAIGALALGGCTGTHIKPVSVCDGKHRRPANLYGSILPSLPGATAGVTAGRRAVDGGAAITRASTGASSRTDPYARCRRYACRLIGPGAMNIPRSAPRTSAQDVAPTYSSC